MTRVFIVFAVFASSLALPVGTPLAYGQGVILLPAGTRPKLTGIQSDTIYRGAGIGKTIVLNADPAAHAHTAELKELRNVRFEGITFKGNGIRLDNVDGFTMTDCEIVDALRSRDSHPGVETHGLRNARFHRVAWRNCNHAVMIYNAVNVVITESLIDGCGYGVKVQLGNGSRAVSIDKTLFRRMRSTMGIEIQGDDPGIDSITVRDCAYVLPQLHDDDSRNKHAFAWSLPMAKATNVLVERCYADGRTEAGRVSTGSWRGLRLAHEVGGTRPVHRHNWVRNCNDPVAITTSTAAQVYDNRIENVIETVDYGAPANGVSAARVGSRIENNAPGVALPEFGGWSLVGVAAAGGGTVPQQPPDAMTLTAEVVDDRTLDFKVANVPELATSVTIWCESTTVGERGPQVGPDVTLAAAPWETRQAGYHPGWSLKFRAIARHGDAEIATSAWIVKQMPGDPTVAWPPPAPPPVVDPPDPVQPQDYPDEFQMTLPGKAPQKYRKAA